MIPDLIKKLEKLRASIIFNVIMLVVLGIVVGMVSLLLGATIFGMPMFKSYLSSPMILILNLAPPILLMLLVYFISARAWIAYTFPVLIIFTLSSVQFFKLQVRGDPFIISDFAHMREASNVVSTYTLTMNWKIILAIFVLLIGIVFSIFMLKYRPATKRIRIIAAAVAVGISATLYVFVYTDTTLYDKTAANAWETGWSAAKKYISTGFMYPFIHSISESKPKPPESYDKQETIQILESYVNTDIPTDKRVNIICLMLEAYTDLSVFNALEFLEDVYAPFHRLQEESVSGMLVTNVFGGGTIDTERLFLTGNTYLTNYRSMTNSYISYLKSQGYFVEGLHAGDMWFYDRRPVNTMLGFDRYYFMEDFANGSRWDSFFFPTVLDLYKARDRDQPYFSFNLSYQNHGAYNSEYTQEPYVIAREGLGEGQREVLSDEAYNILNNYLSGILDTNRRLESFIDSLRDDADPVIVLAFGDHMPWLGVNDHVYAELGINIDTSTQEGFLNYFSTQYIIWANDAAKAMLDNDFLGDGGSFSTCFLMGEVFRRCSWAGEGYMQALREFMDAVDVISPSAGIFRENGQLSRELSPDAAILYRKLKALEYYRLSNYY